MSRAGRNRWTPRARHRQAYLMVAIMLLFFLVFSYVPMYGLVIAFKDFSMARGILGSQWTGLENFRYLLGSADFPRALRNTIVISLLSLGLGFLAPIGVALLLNEVRVAWYKRSIQTITYLPHFFSWVILGGIFRMLFSGSGPLNSLVLSATGSAEPLPFLTHKGWFLAVLIGTRIWQQAGWGAIIYLAALSGISPNLYEAAMVDGASRWRQTLHITLPSLAPTMVVLFILRLGHVLNAGFDQIYNMYTISVFESADILDTYILRLMQRMDFDIGTAAGLFKSVVGLGFILGANAIARRASHGEKGLF